MIIILTRKFCSIDKKLSSEEIMTEATRIKEEQSIPELRTQRRKLDCWEVEIKHLELEHKRRVLEFRLTATEFIKGKR